ncbi:hypothetical protein [Amphibacillus cookii]|uniref:hypothetical protein n=1 Tax=Amphibacillus cookii TaxID=767787 RepID=UPI00195E6FDB|nr:hypothetical protein [Amphibacillus cookii]MBM7541114.1 hypothetical protein [Amphibacillus cookii]
MLALLTNVCLLFTANYAVASIINEELVPYELSQNYVKLTRIKKTTAQAQDIIDFNDYDQLIIIAEINDSHVVGLLDLQMKFYNQSTKAIAPHMYRYFSEDDYTSGAPVGFVVNSCDFVDVEAVKTSKTTYQLDEVINCLYSEVWDEHAINMVQNMYSIDFTKVTRVFIDSTDSQEVTMAKRKLIDHGFASVDKDYNLSVVNIFLDSLSRGKHEQFLTVASLSVFILYVSMAFLFFHRYTKYIRVSRMVGGNFKRMLLFTSTVTAVISLILSNIAYLVLFYFKFIDVYYINFEIFLKIQLFMLLCNLILATVNLSLYYKRTENLARRS